MKSLYVLCCLSMGFLLVPKQTESIEVYEVPTLIIMAELTDTFFAEEHDEAYYHEIFYGDQKETVNAYLQDNSYGVYSISPVPETEGIQNDGVVRVSVNKPLPESHLNDLEIPEEALKQAAPFVDFSLFDKNKDKRITGNELHVSIVLPTQTKGFYPVSFDQEGHPIKKESIRQESYRANHFSKTIPYLQKDVLLEYTEISMNAEYDPWYIFTHETLHAFGTDDLYDDDMSSNGLGQLSIMSSGSAGMDAYSKWKAGFVSPESITEEGVYTVYASTSRRYNILKIPTKSETEFFLLEYRTFGDYDQMLTEDLQRGGLAIWHVNEAMINNNHEYQKTADLIEPNEMTKGFAYLDELYYPFTGKENLFFSLKSGVSKFGSRTPRTSFLNTGEESGIDISIIEETEDAMKVSISFDNETNSHNVFGRVILDQKPLTEATVHIRSTQNQLYQVETDAYGNFSTSLPDGTYHTEGIWNEKEDLWMDAPDSFRIKEGESDKPSLRYVLYETEGTVFLNNQTLRHSTFSLTHLESGETYKVSTDRSGSFDTFLPYGRYVGTIIHNQKTYTIFPNDPIFYIKSNHLRFETYDEPDNHSAFHEKTPVS